MRPCTIDIRVDIRRDVDQAEIGLALYAGPEDLSESWRGSQIVRSLGAIVPVRKHREVVQRMRRQAEDWARLQGFEVTESPRMVMEGSLLEEVRAE